MADTSRETTLIIPAAVALPPLPAGKVLAVALLLTSPALVAGALTSGLLNYRDDRIVTTNPLVREGFSGETLSRVFRPSSGEMEKYCGEYAPLTCVTVGLQSRLHGPSGWAFRLVNLLLHLGAALLLYQVMLSVLPSGPAYSIARDTVNSDTPFQGREPAVAALAAGFFFLHPTNVESVSWVSGRCSVQAGFFCVLAWWLVTRGGADAVRWGRLAPPAAWQVVLGLVSFAAGVLSKPEAVGFAPLMILTELVWVRGGWPGRAGRSVAWAAAAIVLARLGTGAGAQEAAAVTGGGYWSWALTSVALLGRYAAHALAPGGLSFFYGAAPVQGLDELGLWAALALLAAAGAVLAWLPMAGRATAVLVPAGVLALGPVLAPHHSGPLFKDQSLYLALPMAAAMAAFGLEAIHYRLRFLGTEEGKRVENAGFLMLVLVSFLLALLSLQRSYQFRDDETLFRDAVKKQPASFLAHFHLAQELARKGAQPTQHPERARELWEEAYAHVRQLGETADAARHGEPLAQRCLEAELAWRLRREEAPELARQVLSKADPEQRVIRARANMILAEVAREEYERTKDPGRLEEQLRRLQAALLLVPQDTGLTPRARLAQAETRELLGQRDEALGEYQALLKEYPELAPQIEVAIRRLQQQTPKP